MFKKTHIKKETIIACVDSNGLTMVHFESTVEGYETDLGQATL